MDLLKSDKLIPANHKLKRTQPNINHTPSLTRLAAQLAHDLNLPLASIIAYAEELIDLAQERYGAEGFKQLVEYIAIIQSEANQCKEIVERMLSYAKGLEINLEVVCIHELLNKCIQQRPTVANDKTIHIKTRFDPKVSNITTDPMGLRQVIMNVLSNARDAIESSGEILIQTRSQKQAICIEIADNGKGIEERYLDKIFDPFFTTKSSRKGTGLGLAICHGILQTLNGKICVASRKGQGTKISIYLPKKIKVVVT